MIVSIFFSLLLDVFYSQQANNLLPVYIHRRFQSVCSSALKDGAIKSLQAPNNKVEINVM